MKLYNLILYFYKILLFFGITISNDILKISVLKTNYLYLRKLELTDFSVLRILTLFIFMKSKFIRSDSKYWKNIYMCNLLDRIKIKLMTFITKIHFSLLNLKYKHYNFSVHSKKLVLDKNENHIHVSCKFLKLFYKNYLIFQINDMNMEYQINSHIYIRAKSIVLNIFPILFQKKNIQEILRNCIFNKSNESSLNYNLQINKIKKNILLGKKLCIELDNLRFDPKKMSFSKLDVMNYKKNIFHIYEFESDFINYEIESIKLELYNSTITKLCNLYSKITKYKLLRIENQFMFEVDIDKNISINTFHINYSKNTHFNLHSLKFKSLDNTYEMRIDKWNLISNHKILLDKIDYNDNPFLIKYFDDNIEIFPYKMRFLFDVLEFNKLSLILGENIMKICDTIHFQMNCRNFLFERIYIQSFSIYFTYIPSMFNLGNLLCGNYIELLNSNILDSKNIEILSKDLNIVYPKSLESIFKIFIHGIVRSVGNINLKNVVKKLPIKGVVNVINLKTNIKYYTGTIKSLLKENTIK